ncbi:MAG: PIG-L family deacetylase [Gemmatimonadetes bacterium]|nr:PIG-L family deacetylase [Gemmatimonadota bacterium]
MKEVPVQGDEGGSASRDEMAEDGRTLLVRVSGRDKPGITAALLAALARGTGAETAYLSLTRGDGGQNLIGPELDEGLGVVRTGELLAARELDGGRQFFTRAFDYGYSKSAQEAFSNWPREELLRDVVWVVRAFRPQVVVSVFSGTPSDGHGQHQAAGIMAREAFRVAADPGRFPDQLAEGVAPWQPSKLYRLAWRDPEAASDTVPTGDFDPLLGRSWYQLAMESRSQHRSQAMGAARPAGRRSSGLVLEESVVDAAPGAGLFAGVDTALAALAGELGAGKDAARSHIRGYREALREAEASLSALRPWVAAPALARGLGHLAEVERAARADGARGAALGRAVERRVEVGRKALLAASGVTLDVTVDEGLVVPGEAVSVTVEVWNGGPYPVDEASALLHMPPGWSAEPLLEPLEGGQRFGRARATGRAPREVAASGRLDPGELARWRFRVALPHDADLSRLYYLERERDGGMYRWPDDPELRGRAKDPPPVHGEARLVVRVPVDGSLTEVPAAPRRAARHVEVDRAEGEVREPLLVVPAVSVGLSPRTMAWPVSLHEERTLSVTLAAEAAAGVRGTLEMEAPPGWTAEPRSIPFAFDGPGQERSLEVRVRPPASLAPGRHLLKAVAVTDDGRRFEEALRVVDYPHIERVAMFDPAETVVSAAPVAVAEGRRVAYVMGSGDDGYRVLRQLGADVELLDPERVRRGDFAGFDVVVLGVRAYETRPDLVASNEALLDFARAGGTVVVQYNRYEYPQGGFAPYPLDISRPHDRITDPAAPVRLLRPDAPVFTTPNRITDEDFAGWVQERGLYFLGEWDPRYTPLLEMADPGEEPTRGALVVAPLGEGLYVYTGLAFFRQFPVGVPGAYRLFANLVSLDAAAWNRHVAQNGGAR